MKGDRGHLTPSSSSWYLPTCSYIVHMHTQIKSSMHQGTREKFIAVTQVGAEGPLAAGAGTHPRHPRPSLLRISSLLPPALPHARTDCHPQSTAADGAARGPHRAQRAFPAWCRASRRQTGLLGKRTAHRADNTGASTLRVSLRLQWSVVVGRLDRLKRSPLSQYSGRYVAECDRGEGRGVPSLSSPTN